MSTYHKDTFEKIPEAKRRRVLDAAITEFARHGFEAVSTNTIAERAGISIGSLYSYFASKQDLFLAVVNQGFDLITMAEHELVDSDEPIEDSLYRLFEMTARYGKKYADMTKLYLLLSTEEMTPFANKMSKKFETSFVGAYHQLLSRAVERGELPENLDINRSAFIIDNLVVMLQLSYATKYHKKRLERYLGEEEMKDTAQLIRVLTDFVMKGLQ